MVLLELVQKFLPQPFILHLDHPPVLLFYVPWLLTLPLAGALVLVYRSRRRLEGHDAFVQCVSCFCRLRPFF